MCDAKIFIIAVLVFGGSVYSASLASSSSREGVGSSALSADELRAQLSQLLSKSTSELKKFYEVSLLTQKELAKYQHLLPSKWQFSLPGHAEEPSVPESASSSSASNRFTQSSVKEPVSSALIRNALYSTQPVSDPPQAFISVDALENVDSVVKNAIDVATFSDDGSRDFFEDELYRMKRELSSSRRLTSLNNKAQLLRSEISRLTTTKPVPPEPLFKENSTRLSEKPGAMKCCCNK